MRLMLTSRWGVSCLAARRKLKRKAPLIICGLLVLVLLAGGFVLAKDLFFPSHTEEGAAVEPVKEGQRLNVLLLGIDAREDENTARSDSIILASVDPKSKQVSLLSIPRDTRVNIPGYGWDKINSASVYGGPELSMKVASSLLGIQVKHYVLTNFMGFKDIVDALGGVTLDVERNMYHVDDAGYGINLKKGEQRLDGNKALQYVRYRNYEMGDIDRTKNQQKFLAALAKEILQPSTIPKLPKLIPEISRYIKTNLSVSDMLKMASAAKSMEDGNIVTQTLPGRPIDVAGGSYWGVDPAEARQAVTTLFSGETVTNVVLQTPLTGQYAVPDEVKPETKDTEIEDKTDTGDESDPPTGEDQEETANSPTKPGQGPGGKNSSGGVVIFTPVDEESDDTTETTPPNSSGEKETGTSSGSTVVTSGTTEVYSPGKTLSDYGIFNDQT